MGFCTGTAESNPGKPGPNIPPKPVLGDEFLVGSELLRGIFVLGGLFWPPEGSFLTPSRYSGIFWLLGQKIPILGLFWA